MIKLLFLVIGSWMGCYLAFSQPVIIPRMGATLSNTNSKTPSGAQQNMLAGFTMGVGFQFDVGSVSIQPEINYVQKGFGLEIHEEDQGFTLFLDNKTRIDYLEVPVFIKKFIGPTSGWYLLVGPSLGIGLGGKSKTKVQTDIFGTPISFSVSAKVKFGDPPLDYNPEEDPEVYLHNRLDFGMQGGFGAIIKKKVNLELRYNYGVSNFYEDEDSQNRVIHLNVGFPLGLTKKIKKE